MVVAPQQGRARCLRCTRFALLLLAPIVLFKLLLWLSVASPPLNAADTRQPAKPAARLLQVQAETALVSEPSDYNVQHERLRNSRTQGKRNVDSNAEAVKGDVRRLRVGLAAVENSEGITPLTVGGVRTTLEALEQPVALAGNDSRAPRLQQAKHVLVRIGCLSCKQASDNRGERYARYLRGRARE